ncbi:MAG TPA: hypothetical protein VFF88_01025, partial [Methylocella sp.]|nr:hypothetical protein [Methylocella sp.]
AGECGSGPFIFVEALAETNHAMPGEARALMPAVLAASRSALVREAAVPLLLDGEPEVRHAAVTALQRNIEGLTPASLRRLIAIRN